MRLHARQPRRSSRSSLARAHERPRAFVVFIKPAASGEAGSTPAFGLRPPRFPVSTVVRDDDGVEARRFGVATSGQTLLYAADGRLLFSGGTTGSRGKTGDNAGPRHASGAAQRRVAPTRAATPVFGCPLFGPADEPETRRRSRLMAHAELTRARFDDGRRRPQTRGRASVREHQQAIYRRTDRMFAHLMWVQWLAGIVFALVVAPRTWAGATSQTHVHVWAAVLLGGAISLFPAVLAVLRPGHARRATSSRRRRC